MKAVEVKDLTKTFKDGSKEIQALFPTNFSVSKGEFVAIIGPSGSGKSTLLTMLGGLQSPTSGDVFIDGQSFTSLKEKERSHMRLEKIGFILQSSNLIPFLKVQDQFKFISKVAKRPFDKEHYDELLSRLEIDTLIDKYPGDLSGGERQRLAIARALYPKPSVILADEPTASLDTERAYEVTKVLAELTKQEEKATIMVTHDERLLTYCDTVYAMRDGILKKA